MSFIILRPLPSIFPTLEAENLVIVVSSKVRKEDEDTGIV